MNHYTYLLINNKSGMLYIGKRSCTCKPQEDTSYMSSSKYVPKEECTKVILREFLTSKEAVAHEIELHNLHDVGINPMYYNKSKQTSTKFDTTGISNPCTEEAKQKLRKAKKGLVPNWSAEGKEQILKNLKRGGSPEAREKAAKAVINNGSNKGIKNSQFKPWYISTETVTHIFRDISKNELSIQENHYKKYYADLQKKFNKLGSPIKTKKYGLIIDMGFLPEQYKI